jgi:hypothetical protein
MTEFPKYTSENPYYEDPYDELENYESSERFQYLAEDADNPAFFNPIIPDKKNSEVLVETIQTPGLARFVVERLAEDERKGKLWWDDEKLASKIKEQTQRGKISVPEDAVERHRWLALVYVSASQKGTFSYGNMLIPADFFPENSKEFQQQKKHYGEGVTDDIISVRNELRRGVRSF